ncbi:hypothetical protein QCA50_019198 [Cerrena zonata]|uniref:Uncharacterized protein n=1 Tax=Cerrena zonata TaxID=2478898 RepID=A0AAW0FBY2_9APHY
MDFIAIFALGMGLIGLMEEDFPVVDEELYKRVLKSRGAASTVGLDEIMLEDSPILGEA